MKFRFTAAFLGALIAVPSLSACSNNNSYEDKAPADEDISAYEEVTEEKSAQPATKSENKKKPVSDYGTPSESALINRQQPVFIMDNGDYVYAAEKKEGNDIVQVYVRDDRKGKTEELELPDNSQIFYSDSERLYYYSLEEGLCEYDNGKSKLLNKETVTADYVPDRKCFYFTDDTVYFALSEDQETKIKSMDYSGKISDQIYTIEHKNARIIGSYNDEPVCSYSIGTSEFIRIFESENSFTEIKAGNCPYIVEEQLYFIDLNKLCRIPLDGGEKEIITDERCTDYCFYGENLIYTDGFSVFSVDTKGKSTPLLDAEKLSKCDFISGLGITDNRIFVCGGSGSFWKCIAEIDENGSVLEEILAGTER